MRRDRVENIVKVVKFIQQSKSTYFREISRNLGLNLRITKEILDYIEPFLTKESVGNNLGMNLPNLPVIIRLKDDFSWDKLEKHIADRERGDRLIKRIKEMSK